MTALYVHVPFCRLRCPYCSFATAPYTEFSAGRFVSAVHRESEMLSPALAEARFETLFLGGGTPSRLTPSEFEKLIDGLRATLPFAERVEFTLEANPEDVEAGRVASWRRAGVNRVSLGVQSLEDAELARLGRAHGRAGARSAIREIAGAFENWSMDLMFGFPGHEPARWRRTLDAALASRPPHLSLYQFTAEPRTPIGDAIGTGRIAGVAEDRMAALFDLAGEACREAGLEHYETSNFARPGFASRHNLAYWRRRPYLGLGPSAVSFWHGRRWRNHTGAEGYAAAVLAGAPWVAECETLAGLEGKEKMMLGLRLAEGVRWCEMPVGEEELLSWQRAAAEMARQGLLRTDADGTRIPERHGRVADGIILLLWEETERLMGASSLR